jgi:hypothetical protein
MLVTKAHLLISGSALMTITDRGTPHNAASPSSKTFITYVPIWVIVASTCTAPDDGTLTTGALPPDFDPLPKWIPICAFAEGCTFVKLRFTVAGWPADTTADDVWTEHRAAFLIATGFNKTDAPSSITRMRKSPGIASALAGMETLTVYTPSVGSQLPNIISLNNPGTLLRNTAVTWDPPGAELENVSFAVTSNVAVEPAVSFMYCSLTPEPNDTRLPSAATYMTLPLIPGAGCTSKTRVDSISMSLILIVTLWLPLSWHVKCTSRTPSLLRSVMGTIGAAPDGGVKLTKTAPPGNALLLSKRSANISGNDAGFPATAV